MMGSGFRRRRGRRDKREREEDGVETKEANIY